VKDDDDETGNAELNGNRNPEWWGDFSQLFRLPFNSAFRVSFFHGTGCKLMGTDFRAT